MSQVIVLLLNRSSYISHFTYWWIWINTYSSLLLLAHHINQHEYLRLKIHNKNVKQIIRSKYDHAFSPIRVKLGKKGCLYALMVTGEKHHNLALHQITSLYLKFLTQATKHVKPEDYMIMMVKNICWWWIRMHEIWNWNDHI